MNKKLDIKNYTSMYEIFLTHADEISRWETFLQFLIKYFSLNVFHATLKYLFYNTYSIKKNIKINKVTKINLHSVDKKV